VENNYIKDSLMQPLWTQFLGKMTDTLPSRACQLSPRDLSKACRLALARPKLSGHRSSSTALNQVCLGLPVLCRLSPVWEEPNCWPEELENA